MNTISSPPNTPLAIDTLSPWTAPSTYIVKRHTNSTPYAFNTFLIEIVGQMCIIKRHYTSNDLTTHYSITKTKGGWTLKCSFDDALSKRYAYRQAKPEMDACQAYDAGFFIMKLEEMADDEWVKVDNREQREVGKV